MQFPQLFRPLTAAPAMSPTGTPSASPSAVPTKSPTLSPSAAPTPSCSGFDETVAISKTHAPKMVNAGGVLKYTAVLRNSQKVGDITTVGVQVQLPAGVTYLSSKLSGYKPALAAPEVDVGAGTVTWPITPLVGKSFGGRFSVRVRVDSNVTAGTELVFRSAFFESGSKPLCTYYGADRTVCTLIHCCRRMDHARTHRTNRTSYGPWSCERG